LDHTWSYLSDRYMQVRVNDYVSSQYDVISSVPQGSRLGQILFDIFIHDIRDRLDFEHLLYADDLKIFRRISKNENTSECMMMYECMK
jgi:ribonuclease P/MRP protein subunit RPP40